MNMQIVQETGRYNEISQIQDAWHVSASGAVWNVLVFNIVDNHPTVYRFESHTEGNHTVRFREGEEKPAALREPQTKLSVRFRANIQYPGASYLRFDEFQRFFTWNRSEEVWKPRAKFRR